MQLTEVQLREREHHDRAAGLLDPARMPFGRPDFYEGLVLRFLGEFRGLRVLELGCGDGGLLPHLVDGGAEVTGLDISPGMIEVAAARLERFRPGADVRLSDAPIERTDFDEGSFDVIVGKWILHHVDIRTASDELERLLSPQGRAIFLENQGRNRLLAFARTHVAGRFGVPRLGTPDEHLLVGEDYAYWASRFELSLHYPDFHCFQLVARQLFSYRRPRPNRWSWAADNAVYRRFPFLRRYSYHVILELRPRPSTAAVPAPTGR